MKGNVSLNFSNMTLTPEQADLFLGGDFMALFRNQLLLCAVQRLGGKLELPVEEVDNTRDLMMEIRVDQEGKKFTLTVSKKN